MQGYQTKLQEYFDEGSKLQEEIMEQLKKVKYEQNETWRNTIRKAWLGF